MTPPAMAEAIVQIVQPSGMILEPCAGADAFVDACRPYGRVEWCEIDRGRDFMAWRDPVDWIITNPPWSQFAAFLAHALQLANHIVFVSTVNHWYTKRRCRLVYAAGFGYKQLLFLPSPTHWPTTGFQVGAMYLAKGYTGPQTNRWIDLQHPIPKRREVA